MQLTESPAPPALSPATHPDFAERRALELLARGGQQAVYLGSDTVLCRVLARYMFYVDATDRGLAPHLMLGGCWEPWVTLAVQRLVRPGMTCIDVGANLGYFTVLMGELVGPTGAVVAFEPNPRLRELAASTLSVNGLQKRTVLSAYAVADQDGVDVSLSVPRGMPMNGNLVFGDGERQHDFAARTVTLDTACRDLERIDLIKIDVEGAEERVWDGMQRLLDAHPETALIFEFNAQRGPDPRRLAAKIAARFPVPCHIDFSGAIAPVSLDQVLTERGSEDWMLYLSADPSMR